jgi:Short C-terminal domain
VALLDHQGGADLPYARDDVFDALVKVIPEQGMKVDKQDKNAGFISAKAGVSLRSWGENIPISVMDGSPGFTRVSITSTPKTGLLGGGAFDLGKNRKNIERILLATSELLQKSATPQASESKSEEPGPEDPGRRLAKLQSLLDEGLIDSDDYARRKQEILSEI